jgi:allantoinase
VNEPGRTDWEGFRTATRAAAAGGVTTIVDMPLNSVPPTVDPAGLVAKRAAADGKLWVDVGLWGGVIPGTARFLRELAASGVPGFKCFLVPSGVDEFPDVGEADLREALPILAELGSVLLVHAEAPGPIAAAEARVRARRSNRGDARISPLRPRRQAVQQLLVRLCRGPGAQSTSYVRLRRRARTLRKARRGLRSPPDLSLHISTQNRSRTALRPSGAPPIREQRHAQRCRR